MQPSSEIVAAQRARWLAELAAALREARKLVKELGAAEGQLEAIELYTQIESLRLEIELIQRQVGRIAAELDPERTELPWQRGGPRTPKFFASGAD